MKQIRKKVEVSCSFCNNLFLKDDSEVKRNLSLGRKNYCSRKCVGKNNIKHFGDKVNRSTLHLNVYNRRDEFTGFREHLRRIKYRNKEVNLTLQDLKSIFEAQNGICPYSGVILTISKNSKNNPIYTMSLDRKDSNIGYIKSNVQFISIAMNHLKNSMNEEQMQEMLKILKN